MATVTSFEGLSMPGKTELRQFAELFEPLYQNSSPEARRLAVAALSQCQALPAAICHFIGCQPIAIAAPFLTVSPALDDDALIAIARTQGAAHAKAIAARRDLSVKVVDALVSLKQEHAASPAENPPARPSETADILALPGRRNDKRLLAEELLREQLKALVMRVPPDRSSQDQAAAQTQQALMVRFARQRQARQFLTVLTDMLNSSAWLAERILLDLSGRQLATTLVALGLEAADSAFILTRFYPHLADGVDGASRASLQLAALDHDACRARLETWMRADAYTANAEAVPFGRPANQDRGDAAASAPVVAAIPAPVPAAIPAPVPLTGFYRAG